MTRPPASAPAIECRALRKSFGSVEAVRGVDLAVQRGRFVALLGPSGCGKTTALRIIAGLETPTSGEVRIGGRVMVGPGVHVRPEQRHLGMVFQEYALFPHLSVEDNVAFGLRGAEDPRRRVGEVLALVGLESVRARMPHQLSGGQQQRVALARALAPDPEVILLDEPFSNLDAALRQRVRAEVRHILREAGVTALFVTHDQEEALSLADEVAVMIDGRIAQCGTPERLYRRPDTHGVATFLGEANFLAGRARGDTALSELGPLRLLAPAEGDVEIMFRPEDLAVEPDEFGLALVVDREYFGHDQMLSIRLPSQTVLKCRMVGCCRGIREGSRVRVRVDSPVVAYPLPYGCPAALIG